MRFSLTYGHGGIVQILLQHDLKGLYVCPAPLRLPVPLTLPNTLIQSAHKGQRFANCKAPA